MRERSRASSKSYDFVARVVRAATRAWAISSVVDYALGFSTISRSGCRLQLSASDFLTAVQSALQIGHSKPSMARSGASSATLRTVRGPAWGLVCATAPSSFGCRTQPTSARTASGSGWRKATGLPLDACTSGALSSSGRSCRRGASTRYPQPSPRVIDLNLAQPRELWHAPRQRGVQHRDLVFLERPALAPDDGLGVLLIFDRR